MNKGYYYKFRREVFFTELTNRLKKRFIKDYSLPIPLTDSPYFEYFIDLYDEMFETKKKLAWFMEIVNRFEDESEVLDYLSSITDKAFNSIKVLDEYQRFISYDMNEFRVNSQYPKNSIFKVNNTGKTLISIDLSKANFQAMNYFDKEILKAATYKEFISKFTSEEYIINSKYIRQIIFGNLNSKRLATVERFMMEKILVELKSRLDIPTECILMVSDDEIVLEGTVEDYYKVVSILDNFEFDVAVEVFVLKTLRKETGEAFKSEKFFVKEFIDYTDEKSVNFEIKATDSTFYSQFYKLVTNSEICENDLVFINEGFVAKYKDKISGEIC